MKRIQFLCLLLITCFSPLASADNLSSIYQMAITNDPQWQAIVENYKAEQEIKTQARSLLLPVVGAVYSKSRVTQDAPNIGVGTDPNLNTQLQNCFDINNQVTPDCNENVINYILGGNSILQLKENGTSKQSTTVDNLSLQLTQPLFNLERWNQYKKSSFVKSKLDSEHEFALQQFVLRVAEAYFNTLKAAEDLAFVKKEELGIGEQLQRSRQRYDAGISGLSEVREAQGAYDRSRTAVLIAQTIYEGALENLNSITNSQQKNLAKLREDFPVTNPQPEDEENWVQQALRSNKKVLTSFHLDQAARQDVVEKNSRHAPTVDFIAGLSNIKTDNGKDAPLGSSGNLLSDTQRTTVGIQITVPLYTGGLVSSQARQASSRSHAAHASLAAEQRAAAALTRNTYRSVVNDVKRVELAKKAVLSSQSALEATQSGYQAGTRNLFDILQAQRSVFAASRDYSGARYDYIMHSLRLKQISGSLSKTDLAILDDWLE